MTGDGDMVGVNGRTSSSPPAAREGGTRNALITLAGTTDEGVLVRARAGAAAPAEAGVAVATATTGWLGGQEAAIEIGHRAAGIVPIQGTGRATVVGRGPKVIVNQVPSHHLRRSWTVRGTGVRERGRGTVENELGSSRGANAGAPTLVAGGDRTNPVTRRSVKKRVVGGEAGAETGTRVGRGVAVQNDRGGASGSRKFIFAAPVLCPVQWLLSASSALRSFSKAENGLFTLKN